MSSVKMNEIKNAKVTKLQKEFVCYPMNSGVGPWDRNAGTQIVGTSVRSYCHDFV